jgi:hypothetical protein
MVSMDKLERFLTAVQLKTPDTVPVSPLIHDRFAHRMLGRTGWEPVFELHQRIGSTHFRGPLGVDVRASQPDGYEYDYEIKESDGARVVTEETLRTPDGTLKGRTVKGFNPNDPTISTRLEPLIKGKEDWAIYRDYYEAWARSIEGPEFQEMARAVRAMGRDGVPSAGLSCVFAHLGSVRTMEKLIIDIQRWPDAVLEACATIQKVIDRYVDSFLKSPSPILYYDICWATGADLSPKLFEMFVKPDINRVVKLVKEYQGKYVGFYTLGRIRRHLGILVEAGAHFIETFEQNQGDITLREVKEKYGGKICLMGNFDSVILSFGSRAEAEREALRCLSEGMADGGYVMVTGDEVPVDAKIENLYTMVEVAEKHGRYK